MTTFVTLTIEKYDDELQGRMDALLDGAGSKIANVCITEKRGEAITSIEGFDRAAVWNALEQLSMAPLFERFFASPAVAAEMLQYAPLPRTLIEVLRACAVPEKVRLESFNRIAKMPEVARTEKVA